MNMNDCFLITLYPGAAYGTAAACFLNPVKGAKTPMITRALGVVATNSVLLGTKVC